MRQRASQIRVTIIGLPTAKVRHAVTNATAALSQFEGRPRVQWINDIQDIATMGSLVVPTILVNDKPKSVGRIPSVYEFEQWIEEERHERSASAVAQVV
ncbi:MAG TPA: thioredoxin family protein [Bacteroidota bacterium]|nr:thioredoxin family protein [Bacteroidota bacterium]